MPCFATAVWLDLRNHLLSTDQFASSAPYLNGAKGFTEWVFLFLREKACSRHPALMAGHVLSLPFDHPSLGLLCLTDIIPFTLKKL